MVNKSKHYGFTLFEMLLVLVIVSSLIMMSLNFTTQKMDDMRRDKAVQQVEYILSAAMTYYLNYGSWPTHGTPSSPEQITSTSSTIVKDNYLPATAITTPWGGSYYIAVNTTNNVNMFQVIFNTPYATTAQIIAGRLPIATTQATLNGSASPTPPSGTPPPAASYVVAQVTVPGQNLNNARSVNFAGIYKANDCVPVPTCPFGMTAQIMVTPAGVYGVAKNSTSPTELFNLNGFLAYVYNNGSGPQDGSTIPSCKEFPNALPGCPAGHSASGQFWRVCLNIQTAAGEVDVSPTSSAITGYILAMTRCAPPGEPT